MTRSTRTAFLGIALAAASQVSHGAGCVIENDEIAVVGALSRETFAGPPNYESIHRGDEAETYWILTIREPIALCPLAAADGNTPTVGSLTRFQLVLGEESRDLTQALIARHAWVRGRIRVGRTSHHHHIGALIEVTELQPATRSAFGVR